MEYFLAMIIILTFIPAYWGQDFLEDPGPQAVIYYVGSEYQLSCAVPGSYHIIWAVFNTPRNRELLTSSDSDVELLRLYGFRVGTFDNDTEYRSRLMVNPTVRQSVSYIECVSWDVSTGAQSRGQRIHVVIDEAPPSDNSTTPSSVFIEDPGPESVIYIVGSQYELNCKVPNTYRIAWLVYFVQSGREVSTSNAVDEYLLRLHGISASYLNLNNMNQSKLTINPTQSHLIDYVYCIAQVNNIDDEIRSHRVDVTVYGPPFPPSDLAVVPIGVGSLRISWVAPFFYPNETLYYNLTVFNLRHSISEPLLNETNLLVQHFFFSNDSTEILNNSGLCDVYRFIVTVRNDFGMSGPSEIIDRSLPTVPNISDVESTIQLMLLKTTNRVFVVILFDSNTGRTCPPYDPVLNYTLTYWEDSIEQNVNETPSSVRDGRMFISGHLSENLHYTTHIKAINSVGSSTSSPIELLTTDVQDVRIIWRNRNTFSIQCSYITGSDARGCVYTLVSGVKGVANITGTVERNQLDGVVALVNANQYVEVLAYDWESDDSFGNISIRRRIDRPTVSSNVIIVGPAPPFGLLGVVIAGMFLVTFFILFLPSLVARNCYNKGYCHGLPLRKPKERLRSIIT